MRQDACRGRAIPLTACGQNQALALAQVLATDAVQAIYSSDFSAPRQQPTALPRGCELSVHYDTRWREMAFGRWEGLTWAEIQQHPATLAAWQADPWHSALQRGNTGAGTRPCQDGVGMSRGAPSHPHCGVGVPWWTTTTPPLCHLGLSPQAHWAIYAQSWLAVGAKHLDEQGTVLTRLNLILMREGL